jgi:tetratricopeptide (TPR) repeat protein
MTVEGGIQGNPLSEFAAAADALRAQRPTRNPRLREAEQAFAENRLADARESLSRFLEKHPADPIAVHLMARTALRLARKEEAEALLARCVLLSPDYDAARYDHACVLYELNKAEAALTELEALLEKDPRNILYRNLKAVVLTATGDHAQALGWYRAMAEEFPHSREIWTTYGAALRSVGLREECIAAYRKAIDLNPGNGAAYWGLAGLKTYRFTDSEIAEMRRQLARAELSGEDRVYLHFTLGKALGDNGQYEKSFENYARANAIQRLAIDYDPAALTKHVRACKSLMTPEFFATRRGFGSAATGPIFIIGMQRAGSTLVEQILASHSAVEATAELPNISLLAEHIGEKIAPLHESSYPAVLAMLDAAALKSFGEQYLETTRSHRRLGRPFFTDKMPYNFLHVGLIHLILPNAKIIDARRHPLGCCFSNFSMHFKSGPLFGYRLAELGQAYAGYVELMAHFDRVLPGRIHRIFYEDLVRAPEKEIRRLVNYLDLPFEEACLEFHQSKRAMDSASSEQVRRPLYDDAIDQWRHFEPWLDPLKRALGPVLEAYPAAPPFQE